MKVLKQKKRAALTVIAAILGAALVIAVIAGCSAGHSSNRAGETDSEPEDFTGIPEIPVASAPGTGLAENRKAVIDFSNSRDGYVMAKFREETRRQVRVVITVPDGTQYIYRLTPGGDFEVLPLSGGNGEYKIEVFEEVEDQMYALAITSTINVTLDDEFAPFLRPNQYVNYNRSSAVVRKAAELTEGIDDPMEKIAAVYNYVVENIVYDSQLAWTVESGYIPDVDAVLSSGKGICFDYAAIMTAMLRSQSIPTRMVLGYTGNDYHAWISVYAGEAGWVDNLIYFDGIDWKIMDPTFAAGAHSDEIMEYIENANNYNALYQY